MKYEIKNHRYTISDNLAANALVVGFSKKIELLELESNLAAVKQLIPLLNTHLDFKDNTYFFNEDFDGFNYKIDQCSNINAWLTKQYNNPLDLENGEFLRIALYNNSTLIIFAHTIISDSRGLVNLAKALILGVDDFEFIYTQDDDAKVNFINKLRVRKYKKLEQEQTEIESVGKIKIKKITLKSNLIFNLCSSNGVSLLSFFITVALSLSKSVRKEICIPFCSKTQDNIVLVNDSSNIKFKRGLEPRLSFYDNCSQLDKLFKSFIKYKPYLLRNSFLNNISPKVIDNPFSNKTYAKLLHSDLLFDALPTVENDKILTTMSFYPSSSFISNSFGVSIIDDKITICSILHDKEGEQLFSSYQQTINLLSKNADIHVK
ncbi:MAG: hypothetical protein PQJ45_02975 [Sphaerochaetaceae bacterium]|nr:hypothetical protein [Sphaerochaetaceae bacterium]MDC7236721.1 hypothetical protein [Sphaerochaetaceae bacterium]